MKSSEKQVLKSTEKYWQVIKSSKEQYAMLPMATDPAPRNT